MIETIPDSWQAALEPVLQTAEARRLGGWLRAEQDAGKVIYPPRGARLAALALTPLDSVRVVILGQDPYHGPGQAHGLAFSVPDGVKVPPSLANIYKELESDIGVAGGIAGGVARQNGGNLAGWARQGVLLLNNTLTVEDGKAGSHAGRGWDAITDAVVAAVVERSQQTGDPVAFILWGSHAAKKAGRIRGLGTGDNQLVIESPHPSPLSAYRGFFGSRPFSRVNAFLQSHGVAPIDWARGGAN